MRRLPRRRSWSLPRRWLLGAAAVLVLVCVAVAAALVAGSGSPSVRTEDRLVPVLDGPRDDQRVAIDTTLYLPTGASAARPAPAVLLAHGFGGSKEDLRADGQALARAGYVALAYSARGFGRSTGAVALDSPDYEVKDVRQLVDLLATRPDVVKDGPGDPRVGIAGASYGGGIALLAAGYDPRVDAIAPVITWSSLARAFSPDAARADGGADPTAPPGVFKQLYAGAFFGTAGAGGVGPRFVPEVVSAYQQSAAAGRATPAALALLDRSSPSSLAGRIRVPTLLVQGEHDTLFPLEESVRNARQVAATGAPVKLVWLGGGHDQPFSAAEQTRIRGLTRAWFDRWLRRDTSVPTGPGFSWARPAGGADGQATSYDAAVASVSSYPVVDHRLAPAGTPAAPGPPRPAVNPAGGQPAALSTLPGLGAAGDLLSRLAPLPPGQSVSWTSDALPAAVEVVGAGTLRLRVASSTTQAVLFARLQDVAPDGSVTLPLGAVAPLRVTGLAGGAAREVEVSLADVVADVPAGHRLRVTLASTDQAYAPYRTPATYQLAAAIGPAALTLPLIRRPAGGSLALVLLVVLAALTAVVAGGWLAAWLLRRRSATAAAAERAGVPGAPPVEVVGLTKSYPDGLRAVDDLTFSVQAGQVVGLLGPNGAGKTTSLRMLLGLVGPTAGEVRLFGRVVRPGSPVLERVGAFVEGPGFLPHVSGLGNLELYWRSTGARMADAGLAEALVVAGLGEAVHKPVRTYSQGMRQRLAIAQALLGRPDLLVLDEPTNGLDPPQIREMREVLRRVAEAGRTVLVSSHLLAEVEQTCDHVVVMARGRLVAAGQTAELVGTGGAVRLELAPGTDLAVAEALVAGLPVVASVRRDSAALVCDLVVGADRADLVAAAVGADLRVEGVSARHRLEDVFLGLVEEPTAPPRAEVLA